MIGQLASPTRNELNVFLPGVLLLLTVSSASHAQESRFEIADGDTVVLLGSTFIERAQKYGHLETALTARWPKAKARFRNLGWSADTVTAESRGIFDPPAAGYKRMVDQIKAIKPSQFVIAYGSNESQRGEAALPEFIQNYEKLLNDIQGDAKLTLVSPHRFEKKAAPLPDATQQHPMLLTYSRAIGDLAQRRQAAFADMMLANYRERSNLTDNGIHFTDAGYHAITDILLEQLGVAYPRQVVSVQRSALAGRVSEWKSQLSLLPWNGLLVRVGALPAGRYELFIDDQPVGKGTAEQWKAGINVGAGPDFAQLQELRDTIIEKNRLYFYHWRPQNVTYLFGFRKHEQGNNAGEVAEFEKLVADIETRIHALQAPREHVWKLQASR